MCLLVTSSQPMRHFAWWEKVFWVWLCVLIAGVLLHVHPVGSWIKSADAAWVQAAGIFVGLLIAVAVPAWQQWHAAKKEESRAKDTARHLAAIATELANSAVFAVETYCNEALSWKPGTAFFPRTSLLEQCNRQMERLNAKLLHEPSLTRVSMLLGLVWRPVSFCFDTSRQWAQPNWQPSPKDMRVLNTRLVNVQKARDNLCSEVARYLAK